MPAPSASTLLFPNLNQHLALDPLHGPILTGLTQFSSLLVPRNCKFKTGQEDGEGGGGGGGLEVKGRCRILHEIEAIITVNEAKALSQEGKKRNLRRLQVLSTRIYTAKALPGPNEPESIRAYLSTPVRAMNLSSDGSGPHHRWYRNYVEATTTDAHIHLSQQLFTVE
ncbi:uncharacterized protein LOC104447478 [Eucalyptus grandis]|uniref:uncharacterized protein LOC104447478 n=1 Tax=Eucalyptus grandis TaxID=71139 RepID=UPI00192EF6E9|nr:uncharacterized protein LOC104447478 [Eucalyptus grandis]